MKWSNKSKSMSKKKLLKKLKSLSRKKYKIPLKKKHQILLMETLVTVNMKETFNVAMKKNNKKSRMHLMKKKHKILLKKRKNTMSQSCTINLLVIILPLKTPLQKRNLLINLNKTLMRKLSRMKTKKSHLRPKSKFLVVNHRTFWSSI
jgi:ABC-type uncharacterized transport system fused permease/ATPase subunit